MTAADRNLIEKLMSLGEDRLEAVFQELMGNPRVLSAFGQVLQRTQEARGRLESTLQQVYAWANLPTRNEVDRLERQIEDLESRIDKLIDSAETLATRAASKAAATSPAAKSAAKPAVSKKPAATKPAARKPAARKPAAKSTAKKPATPKKASAAKATPKTSGGAA